VRGLRRSHPELGSLAVMVLGVGHTGLKTARHLRSEKLGRLLLANRTRARADEVAAELDAEVVPWEEHAAHIADVDAVLVAVQVAEPVVTPELVRAAMNGRTRPLTLVDLSLPRAVAHAVEEVPGVTLIDLSRLEEQVAESRARRESEIPRVEALLEAALLEYEEEAAEQAARPLTAELRVRAEAIRKAEVERAVAAGLGDPDVLDYVTRRVVDRMLRAPSSALRQTTRARTSGGPPCLECVFGDQERSGHDAG
jgi:glutamyl-tRNA reductase